MSCLLNAKCCDCFFWEPLPNNQQPSSERQRGYCHKNPPQVVLSHIQQGEYGSSVRTKTVFPDTDQDDWCGSYLED